MLVPTALNRKNEGEQRKRYVNAKIGNLVHPELARRFSDVIFEGQSEGEFHESPGFKPVHLTALIRLRSAGR